MTLTPIEAYTKDKETRGFRSDPAQLYAVEQTQQLYTSLITSPDSDKEKSLFSFFKKDKSKSITGLYFWGGVGRGKSYLIDTFYDCLPFSEKSRVHFNHFMHDIHGQLKTLPKTPDPLVIVAKDIAAKYRVLCIDEFHVDDITDAMIMAGLLDALFSEAVTLVTTSNIAPDELYKNGLQRSRFLPAIELIKQHTKTVHLENGVDYRLALLEKHGTYHVNKDSLDDTVIMQQHLQELANTKIDNNPTINLNGRALQCRARSDNQIWFSFSEICQTPRSSADYIALSRDYETLMVSGIPQMDDGKNDVVQRFIHLIDALYDHKVKFIASAVSEPDQLYIGERLSFPFQRTISRLFEMRSESYLSQAHISEY